MPLSATTLSPHSLSYIFSHSQLRLPHTQQLNNSSSFLKPKPLTPQFHRLQVSRRSPNYPPGGGESFVDDPRNWSRSINSEIDRPCGFEDDDEDDEDEDEDNEEDRSLDLLVRFVQIVFKKVLKRASRAVRSVLPVAIPTKLVGFSVNGVLMLAFLWVLKAFLEALPTDARAGQGPPEEIVAVLRPGNYVESSSSKTLDQKYIVKNNLEMCMEIKFRGDAKDLPKVQHVISERIGPKSLKGIQGLYIFPVKSKVPGLFQKAGVYTFSFLVNDSDCKSVERKVRIKPSSKVGKWELRSGDQPLQVRVGSISPPETVARYDNDISGTSAILC